jgi:SAM-dependent methyltransferase
MLFHEDINLSRDGWGNSSIRRFIDSRGEKLILELAFPRAGERLLDVGCGAGEHLLFFRNQGCSVTGVDVSFARIEAAKNKMGHRADIQEGRAEDLPFSDNEFDVVTLISTLEYSADPERAISEAIRVSRDRVFVGAWNKYAIMNSHGGVKDVFLSATGESSAHLLGGLQLVRWIRNLLPSVPIEWGSVLFFPLEWYTFAANLELHIPMRKNPFGAFLGLSFPVQASYRTVQNVIREPLEVNSKRRQPIQGVAITASHRLHKIERGHRGLFPDLLQGPGFLLRRDRPDGSHKGFLPFHNLDGWRFPPFSNVPQ